MARVVLDQVSKTYPASGSGNRAAPAVRGVSLDIADGELMVLVGPSGCGKSTLLRLVAGLETADAGTISIAGRVVNDLPPKDRDLAMVFQNYALYPHLTVFENLAFGLKLRKVPHAEIITRVHSAADQLGLADVLHRLPKALSGGQRQRVAVGRALVRQPKVFLFDEPLSNLDAQLRTATRAEISRLHTRLASTMIYVTHDQVEAMTLGDRICVMKAGVIQQVAAPLDLYNSPANLFVAGFIGSPPMNFIPGKIENTSAGPVFVATHSDPASVISQSPPRTPASINSSIRLPLSTERFSSSHFQSFSLPRQVILGVRPENLHAPATVTPNAAATITAKIELIEPMGAETIVHVRVGNRPLIARVPPAERFELNQEIVLRPNLALSHLFDPETGHALG